MKVKCFGNPQAALDHLAKHSCDIVLCDFNLPGMNGEQFFERLRQGYSATLPRFVFMTGELFDPANVERYRQLGAALVEKPFQVSALAALLQGLLKPQTAQIG